MKVLKYTMLDEMKCTAIDKIILKRLTTKAWSPYGIIVMMMEFALGTE
jgi:hypothetical protein